MQTVLATILAAAAAYLLGSVSFAVVVSKGLYHQDVRQFGQRQCRDDQYPAYIREKGRSPDAGG